jgi:hypothetical protein
LRSRSQLWLHARPERPHLALIATVVGQTTPLPFSSVARTTKLSAKSGPDGPAGVTGASCMPVLTLPARGGVDVSYAPSDPGSTPKNDESKGLWTGEMLSQAVVGGRQQD